MHPFLVHSASLNYSGDMRLAFNLGVRWRQTCAAAQPAEDGCVADGSADVDADCNHTGAFPYNP